MAVGSHSSLIHVVQYGTERRSLWHLGMVFGYKGMHVCGVLGGLDTIETFVGIRRELLGYKRIHVILIVNSSTFSTEYFQSSWTCWWLCGICLAGFVVRLAHGHPRLALRHLPKTQIRHSLLHLSFHQQTTLYASSGQINRAVSCCLYSPPGFLLHIHVPSYLSLPPTRWTCKPCLPQRRMAPMADSQCVLQFDQTIWTYS